MIELELNMFSRNLFLWTNSVNLSSYGFTPSGEAQSDCTKYCECLYIRDES